MKNDQSRSTQPPQRGYEGEAHSGRAGRGGDASLDKKITQLIVFHVADEEFGVPIGEIQEIIRMRPITPIPDSPEFIRGLINVRGDIVAVIDVKARFSLPRAATDAPKHIIITKRDEIPFGLIVDEVTEVLRIPETEIKKAPELVTHLHQQYVTGVVTIENRLLILIDLAQVLSEEELERMVEVQRKLPDDQPFDQLSADVQGTPHTADDTVEKETRP